MRTLPSPSGNSLFSGELTMSGLPLTRDLWTGELAQAVKDQPEPCKATAGAETSRTNWLNTRRSWARLDSNQGPTDYESAALTT